MTKSAQGPDLVKNLACMPNDEEMLLTYLRERIFLGSKQFSQIIISIIFWVAIINIISTDH